ncbi:MAG: hypothetical protein ACLTZM_11740 [Ruminococcus sp.]
MSESIQSTLISALPAATKVSDTDIVVLENGSTTQKITIAQLKEALGINALNTNFKFYSSLSQIGLTASATWDQILTKLADGTGIKFAAWKSDYPNLSNPCTSNRQSITVCRLYLVLFYYRSVGY